MEKMNKVMMRVPKKKKQNILVLKFKIMIKRSHHKDQKFYLKILIWKH